MNTKLKSISFDISPKNEKGEDYFSSYSVYDFSFNEGISELYFGKIKFYATQALQASKLQEQIGKLISISIEITDNLCNPGNPKGSSKDNQDYNFKKTVNGIISSVKFLGKTTTVTTKMSNKPASMYEIEFQSPFEILKNRHSCYHDDSYGKLQDKLEKIFTNPQKIVYGDDIDTSSPLTVKFELLDSQDKQGFSALPDNVCIQIGSYSPFYAFSKIITDFGLNYNILHEDKGGEKSLKVYLSKGYGVNKGMAVENDYLDKANADKLNYDNAINCDLSDSGTPIISKFTIDVNPNNIATANNKDFLIYATTTDKIALTTQTNCKTEALKNLENKKARENIKYQLAASHIVFAPGSVINANNYSESGITLIADHIDLHICATPNMQLFNCSEEIKPSIEENICAYELVQNNEPGSFAAYLKDEEKITTKNSDVTVYATQNNVLVLEAVVTDGDGNYTGEWQAPDDDPSVKEPRAGSICICAGDNTEKPSMFYALPAGQDKPVQVRVTSTVAYSEIFNMPRIGQKVLLLSGNNNYYLHSFLSQKDSTITQESNRVKRNNALATIKGFASHSHGARVHVWNAADKSKNIGLKGYNADESKFRLSDIILEKNTDLKEYIKNKISDGSESSIVEALILEDNTYKYYQDYSGSSSIKSSYLGDLKSSDLKELQEKSIKKRCEAIKNLLMKTKKDVDDQQEKLNKIQQDINDKTREKDIASVELLSLSGDEKAKKQKKIDSLVEEINSLKKKLTSDDIKKVNDNYNKALKGLEAVTNEFVGEIGIPNYFSETVNDVFKIDHEGNLEINCPKGTVSINAKNIKLTSSKSASITGSGDITMTSPGSIKMGCSGTTFNILSSAIKASVIPFANGSLISFGSTLNLDAYEGTSIKAPTVDITGKFAASLKDGVGAGFKVSKGVSGVSGTEASLASGTLPSATKSLIKFDMDLTKELANTITVNANPDASKYEKGIIDGVLFPLANEAMGFYFGDDIFSKYNKKRKDYKDDREETKRGIEAQKNKSKEAQAEAKDADRRTVARFVVDTCDFTCDVLDFTAKAMDIVTEIAKMANEDNWFERKGLVGKNNAQDIKYFFASLKYTLNTVSIHAVVMANKWGIKPAKVAIRGGEVSILSTTETNAVIQKMDSRPLV